MKTPTLTPELLHRMNAYWRAANYLSVGQIYLYDNPLLKRAAEAVAREAAGGRALGHDAGPEFHLRAPEPGHQEVRPGHVLHRRSRPWRPGDGGQCLPRRHLERGLSEHHPGRSRAEETVQAVLVSRRNFQPRRADDAGVDSRRRRAGVLAQPCLRGSVRQSRSDRRLRHRRRRSGDGPLATAWQSNKFLDPITDGAVLPILHLNGYKISNPTVLARIEHEELEQFLRGCGWTPYFVEGDEPETMHQLMAAALDKAIEDIRQIQSNARNKNDTTRPRWPMIVLQVAQGLDGTESRRRPADRGHVPSAPGAAARGCRASRACRSSSKAG